MREFIYERDPERDTEKSFAFRPLGKRLIVINGNAAYISKKAFEETEGPCDRIVIRTEYDAG